MGQYSLLGKKKYLKAESRKPISYFDQVPSVVETFLRKHVIPSKSRMDTSSGQRRFISFRRFRQYV